MIALALAVSASIVIAFEYLFRYGPMRAARREVAYAVAWALSLVNATVLAFVFRSTQASLVRTVVWFSACTWLMRLCVQAWASRLSWADVLAAAMVLAALFVSSGRLQ